MSTEQDDLKEIQEFVAAHSERAVIEHYASSFRSVVAAHGDLAAIAFALVGAELAAKYAEA